MDVIKQIVIVPASREIHIQLPNEAATNVQAEVIVLYQPAILDFDEKLAAMHEAATDEMFLDDLHETASDYQPVDFENMESEVL